MCTTKVRTLLNFGKTKFVCHLVCIDAHVANCSSQVLVFAVVDVAPCFRVNVLFSQAKVDHMNYVTMTSG